MAQRVPLSSLVSGGHRLTSRWQTGPVHRSLMIITQNRVPVDPGFFWQGLPTSSLDQFKSNVEPFLFLFNYLNGPSKFSEMAWIKHWMASTVIQIWYGLFFKTTVRLFSSAFSEGRVPSAMFSFSHCLYFRPDPPPLSLYGCPVMNFWSWHIMLAAKSRVPLWSPAHLALW